MKSKNTLLNEMNEIVTVFLYYINILNREDGLCLSSGSEPSKSEATRYIARVFKSFMTLNEIEKEMLNNEYFHREKSGWWINKYDKESFQNQLLSSISVFLRKFYENQY